eukprot:352605_1
MGADLCGSKRDVVSTNMSNNLYLRSSIDELDYVKVLFYGYIRIAQTPLLKIPQEIIKLIFNFYTSSISNIEKIKIGISTTQQNEYNLALIGDIAVGKTSILKQFMYKEFDGKYAVSHGVDLALKTICMNDDLLTLKIYDVGRPVKYRSKTISCFSYISDSSIILVVYDVTNKLSFDNTTKWINSIRDELGFNVLIILVGNKIDLEQHIQVTTLEGRMKSIHLNVLFCEISANNSGSNNIETLFKQIAFHLHST